MGKTMILYRGSLKSCNYWCSYCPFSKHRGSAKEYNEDRQHWEQFLESVINHESKKGSLSIGGLMVVPYGEALIHSWYWQGLGRLSALKSMEILGAQTNLSFSIDRSLELYEQSGGRREKLRLWATFHPEMETADTFAQKCRSLLDAGVLVCAGAVGNPENLGELRRLRKLLSEDLYFWINKMDGLKRPYSQKEQDAFTELDPFFLRELVPVKASAEQCRGRVFVEGDGTLKSCNISQARTENWYDFTNDETSERLREVLEHPVCRRKLCSCYLAYGGRSDVMNQMIFGAYPLFRIPRKAKAVFLDIDGTLIPEKNREKDGEAGRVSQSARTDLELLNHTGTRLFFATSLSYEDAARRCREIWHLFEGGVFGGGGYVVWKESREPEIIRENISPISEIWCLIIKELGKSLKSRVLIYRRKGIAYKATLLRPRGSSWSKKETEWAADYLRRRCSADVRVFAEQHCLEIVAAESSKANGVKTLCSWMGISPAEAAAAGDSLEDREMIEMCRQKGETDDIISSREELGKQVKMRIDKQLMN